MFAARGMVRRSAFSRRISLQVYGPICPGELVRVVVAAEAAQDLLLVGLQVAHTLPFAVGIRLLMPPVAHGVARQGLVGAGGPHLVADGRSPLERQQVTRVAQPTPGLS